MTTPAKSSNGCTQFLDKLLCRDSVVQTEVKRTVEINPHHKHHHHLHAHLPHHHGHYRNNYTSTTKYNLFTYFPKALFEQYRRVANVYFTLVAGLSLTPYSPVRPYTTFLPLVIVLGVSMIKEAVEDYARHKSDNEINMRMVKVMNHETGTFEEKTWQSVVVGDIVIVNKDEFFPADLLLLTAENEEGTCYIETMNLDGETNLKIKKALDQTLHYTVDTLHEFTGVVECEPPNSRLYTFIGNLTMPGVDNQEVPKVSVSAASILLRGCSLRNTRRICGAVIYAGHDTKVFMNATSPPSKRSKIELTIDKIIYFMFALLISMCMIGSIYYAWWSENKFINFWYLGPASPSTQYQPGNPVAVWGTNFITSFILYGYLIPISLYVCVEGVKIFQVKFMEWDEEMYHAETDKFAIARTSNLNEELGMVDTVLSDKTGTLTRNVMEFFKCSIAGVSYGAGVTEIERSNAIRRGQKVDDGDAPEAAQYRERFFNFYDKRLMGVEWTKQPEAEIIEMFFRMLAVCQSVIPDGPPDEKTLTYEAESPDESALVVAAKVFGFFFYKRTNTSAFVLERTREGTREVEYVVLNVLEFTSTRKRMSVIVRDSNGKIFIFTKGADSVIYERLDIKFAPNARMRELTHKHLEEYGNAGLRTLCLAYTELQPEWFDAWNERWAEARTSLENREAKLGELAEEAERGLRLLGCTAIEDKLQEGVPDCIRTLAKAGIRIWVLTGDKVETAVNIGFACELLTEEMHQFVINGNIKEVEDLEVQGRMEEADLVGHNHVKAELDAAIVKMDSDSNRVYALVIDGKALTYGLASSLSQLLLSVGGRCKSVLCCRVSPLQKALVTALVRARGDTTLAIGDGANDVGMIQKAHIGVGISGKEGMQAVMASDFAIAQFRFLTPLLLAHGRSNYRRLSRMICFFFYKNLMFGFTIFVYNAYNLFSGQYPYEDFYMTLFNVIFAVALPIAIGIFDRDVDRKWVYKYPGLYLEGQRNGCFNFKTFMGWMCLSAYQTTMILLFVLKGYTHRVADRAGGQNHGLYDSGLEMFSIIILTIHFSMFVIIEQITVLHQFAIWASILLWWLFIIIYGAFPITISTNLYYLFLYSAANAATFWLYLHAGVMVCTVPWFFYVQVRRYLFPADNQLVQELDYLERKAGAKGLNHDKGLELGAPRLISHQEPVTLRMQHSATTQRKGGGIQSERVTQDAERGMSKGGADGKTRSCCSPLCCVSSQDQEKTEVVNFTNTATPDSRQASEHPTQIGVMPRKTVDDKDLEIYTTAV